MGKYMDIHHLSFAYGMGYITFLANAFSLNPAKKYYQQLFKRKTYLVHCFICGLIAVFGFYRVIKVNSHDGGFIMPLYFLVFFKLFDLLSQKKMGRHIILAYRGDNFPNEYVWWFDGLLGFLLICISFLLPILFSLYIGKK
jgi:hypothetical protein